MAKKRIVIVYHSQEAGNTKAAAELLAEGIREAGDFEVALYNTNDGRVNPEVLAGCAGVAAITRLSAPWPDTWRRHPITS